MFGFVWQFLRYDQAVARAQTSERKLHAVKCTAGRQLAQKQRIIEKNERSAAISKGKKVANLKKELARTKKGASISKGKVMAKLEQKRKRSVAATKGHGSRRVNQVKKGVKQGKEVKNGNGNKTKKNNEK